MTSRSFCVDYAQYLGSKVDTVSLPASHFFKYPKPNKTLHTTLGAYICNPKQPLRHGDCEARDLE